MEKQGLGLEQEDQTERVREEGVKEKILGFTAKIEGCLKNCQET